MSVSVGPLHELSAAGLGWTRRRSMVKRALYSACHDGPLTGHRGNVSSEFARDERFRHVYASCFPALLAYALRRVEQPADAADVVAETFLVAWRRSRELPPGDEAKLWLYGVAHRVVANHHRSALRRQRLGHRLRQQITSAVAVDPGTEVLERLTVQTALARLGARDREVLTLTIWEGLEPRDIAAVLELTPAAVRTRLSRARSRLRELLGHDLAPPGHVPDVLTEPTPKEGR
jgi:RNA polymerase sigma factor (sigma-70 family)